jgi:hypothetical protein
VRGWRTGPTQRSVREEKRAADPWDREGTEVNLAVVHRERERERDDGAGSRCGSGRVRTIKKEIDFEYRKLFSIQHRIENNSEEIARCL